MVRPIKFSLHWLPTFCGQYNTANKNVEEILTLNLKSDMGKEEHCLPRNLRGRGRVGVGFTH